MVGAVVHFTGSMGPSTKRMISPTANSSGDRARIYPPWAPRRLATYPPWRNWARMASRNLAGMAWVAAIAEMATGSPSSRLASSKTARTAYWHFRDRLILWPFQYHIFPIGIIYNKPRLSRTIFRKIVGCCEMHFTCHQRHPMGCGEGCVPFSPFIPRSALREPQGGPSRSTMLTALSPSKGMVEGRNPAPSRWIRTSPQQARNAKPACVTSFPRPLVPQSLRPSPSSVTHPRQFPATPFNGRLEAAGLRSGRRKEKATSYFTARRSPALRFAVFSSTHFPRPLFRGGAAHRHSSSLPAIAFGDGGSPDSSERRKATIVRARKSGMAKRTRWANSPTAQRSVHFTTA